MGHIFARLKQRRDGYLVRLRNGFKGPHPQRGAGAASLWWLMTPRITNQRRESEEALRVAMDLASSSLTISQELRELWLGEPICAAFLFRAGPLEGDGEFLTWSNA